MNPNPIAGDDATEAARKSGWIVKQGGNPKDAWKKRFMVLCGPSLHYYSDAPKGEIPYLSATHIEPEDSPQYKGRPYCFRIATPDRVYRISCDSADEMNSWLKLLQDRKQAHDKLEDDKRKSLVMKAKLKRQLTDMYDIVIDIDNLIDLEEGWKIYFAQRLLSRIEGAAVINKPLDPETVNNLSLSTTKVVVSVLGLFNKGKTFLLNKICNENFDSGYKVTTRGLSFKEPYDMNNIILLDTAGTSSPLQIKNPKSTLAVKKSTEDFLQKMSFLLSDIIIVVVNELTWPDQEYMTALAEQVRERPNDAVDNKIIVVHNYKDAETVEDYLIMRQKFCVNCFEGSQRFTDVQLRTGRERADFFLSNGGALQHVFLAKEGSPAGNMYNERTLELIRMWIRTRNISSSQPLISKFCTLAAAELRIYFSKIKSLYLVHTPINPRPQSVRIAVKRINTNEGWGDTPTNWEEETESTPYKIKAVSINGDDLGYIHNHITFEGFHLALSSTIFQPKFDVIERDDHFIVAVECPGIEREVKLVDLRQLTEDTTSSWIGATVGLIKNVRHLIIQGHKSLSFPSPNNATDIPYRLQPSEEVKRRQLPSGSFTQAYPLPVYYKSEITKTVLKGGQFFIFIQKDNHLVNHNN